MYEICEKYYLVGSSWEKWRNEHKQSRKKIYLFSGPGPIGGRGKGRTTKKNNFFWRSKKKKSEKNVTTKLTGGGIRALVVGQLKKNFFAAFLSMIYYIISPLVIFFLQIYIIYNIMKLYLHRFPNKTRLRFSKTFI